jgi:hypothetical protein
MAEDRRARAKVKERGELAPGRADVQFARQPEESDRFRGA